MSKISVDPQILKHELELNSEVVLVATVEDLFVAWKNKLSQNNQNASCVPGHFQDMKTIVPIAKKFNPPRSSTLCHYSPVSASMLTDSVPSIAKESVGYMLDFFHDYLANLVSPIKDTLTHVVSIAKDLGLTGKVLLKKVKGIDYVIIKGYAGTRKFLTGTRYLSTNQKIIKLAIGKVALTKTIKAGGILTLCVTIGLDILGLVFGDKELNEFGITVASDLVKIGISTLIAEAAGMLAAGVAGISAFAAGPIIITIAVGILVGYSLDAFDRHYNITNRVAAMMEKMSEKIIEEIDEAQQQVTGNIYQGIRGWIYHASGVDIENPVRLR